MRSKRCAIRGGNLQGPSIDAYDAPERVRRYDADMDVMHPLRHEMIRVALDILPFDADDSIRALELGTGTGVLARALVDRFPRAKLVAVDGSREMLDVARERLKDAVDRVEWVVSDFLRLPEKLVADATYDVVLSSYALHHLESDEKLHVVSRVIAALVPGGWFVNADLIASASPLCERRFQELRIDGILSRAPAGDARFTDGESTRRFLDELEARERDRPQVLDDDLRTFRSAGLATVEIVWKELREVVVAGTKPVPRGSS